MEGKPDYKLRYTERGEFRNALVLAGLPFVLGIVFLLWFWLWWNRKGKTSSSLFLRFLHATFAPKSRGGLPNFEEARDHFMTLVEIVKLTSLLIVLFTDATQDYTCGVPNHLYGREPFNTLPDRFSTFDCPITGLSWDSAIDAPNYTLGIERFAAKYNFTVNEISVLSDVCYLLGSYAPGSDNLGTSTTFVLIFVELATLLYFFLWQKQLLAPKFYIANTIVLWGLSVMWLFAFRVAIVSVGGCYCRVNSGTLTLYVFSSGMYSIIASLVLMGGTYLQHIADAVTSAV